MPSLTELVDGKVAVVTGAASGIGLRAASRFAAAGARVVLADRDASQLERAVAEIGTAATAVDCDVTSETDCLRLRQAALEAGQIGIVMANAGVALGGQLDSIPFEEWSRILDVNVIGVVRTIVPFVSTLTELDAGRVVITGSSAGLFSVAGGANAPYATTKFALLGLARALGRHFETTGVEVHYLAPRLTDTPFPRSSVAWGPQGARVTADRSVEGADTVDHVVEALVDGLESNRFLISLTPDTEQLLRDWATHPRP